MSRIPMPSRSTPQPSRGTPQSSRGTPQRRLAPSPTKLTAPTESPRLRTKSTVTRTTSLAPDAAETPRVRTKSTVARSTTPSKPMKKAFADTDSFLDKPKSSQDEAKPLSIKEAIALKRAEAKKTQTRGAPSPLDNLGSLADAIPDVPPAEDDDILGRPPLRQTIEQAKTTGSINLSTRSLQCIPSALFDLHLGITPEPLKSVPEEPPLPPPSEVRRRANQSPAWFDTRDLEIIKAWGNEIVEIQPEISLFGSLKSIDLHKNKIVSLPDQFTELLSLTTLDLSHNALTSLPVDLFSLPALSNLNVGNNALTSLPFSSTFSGSKPQKPRSSGRGLFGGPEVARASAPLPKLAIFDASSNHLTAESIDTNIPKSIVNLDLSGNPLESGEGSQASAKLLAALSTLQKLKVFRCEKAEISDNAFDSISHSSRPFPVVAVLDFGSTSVTESGAARGLKTLSQELTFDITNDDPPPGVARVIIGKQIVREAWEIEAERRSKSRTGKTADESEQGVFPPSRSKSVQSNSRPPVPVLKAPVVKEQWEIDAEQGLLTEGGRRRARAAAAAAAESADLGLGAPPRQSSPTKASSLADPQYYTAKTETLVLPASTAAPKLTGHARAISLAATPLLKSGPAAASSVALPTATLPLSLIAAQPFSQTLKVLLLKNRRMDRSFALPPMPHSEVLLPRLEELSLEGCNLGDSVSISHVSAEETTPVHPSETKPLLPLLTELFPGLRSLDLSYNTITSAALTTPVLSSLILSSPGRKGLQQLHLRGNRITELDGFQDIASMFKGNRTVPEWGMDELDVRDNEIGKLHSELGLLPLDIFLVDGNVFRVPARRVWEREGTKGLLSWLRGRMD
ncbi:hypothetical protein R3P38DRAFT_2867969 [Favolaschia claudopus]|uniref:Leucine-rich repeat-containing protein 40 n=1 Tax=Favolaschia claudopus TaxID=2862362 RepID=A0AAW0DAM4_9AGAR